MISEVQVSVAFIARPLLPAIYSGFTGRPLLPGPYCQPFTIRLLLLGLYWKALTASHLLSGFYFKAFIAMPLLQAIYYQAFTVRPFLPDLYCQAFIAWLLLPGLYWQAYTASHLLPGRYCKAFIAKPLLPAIYFQAYTGRPYSQAFTAKLKNTARHLFPGTARSQVRTVFTGIVRAQWGRDSAHTMQACDDDITRYIYPTSNRAWAGGGVLFARSNLSPTGTRPNKFVQQAVCWGKISHKGIVLKIKQ
jgi:hypothetical protein